MNDGIDIQLVRNSYQKMTDDELVRSAMEARNELTPEGQKVLDEEIEKRNLDINSIKLVPEEIYKNNEIAGSVKSREFALLFTFLFGPFGLLYVSITYGIVLIVLGIIGFAVFAQIGVILVWLLSIAIAFTATKNSNNNNLAKAQPTYDKDSILNQLSQLHTLKEKGVIPEEIYEQEKQKTLNKLALSDD